MATTNPYEQRARDRKAAAILSELRKAARPHALTVGTLEQLDQRAWNSAALCAGVRPPSAATIARAIELVRLASGAEESAVPE